ncbi:MAG TPA: sterol carrier protein domain-containing protein, partial [Fimbriimonadaceae bacterium]|nr:sterol carrier protein domain-containing protein [Fimbriimonadaceae bacterium]
SGVNLRNPVQWWRTLGGDRPLMVYAAGDPVEAYAVLRLNPDFWVLQEVKEFIWSTRRGYEAILSLFSSLSINKTEIDWFEPGDSPYLAKYFDKGAQLLVDRQIMFRVLDVPEALSLLSATSHGEFTLEVADEELPENRGPWRIAFSPDGVNVEKASDAELQMDIRHFSQALLGEPSFAQLARQGLVDVAGLSSVEAASRLLPAQPVYCPDFF